MPRTRISPTGHVLHNTPGQRVAMSEAAHISQGDPEAKITSSDSVDKDAGIRLWTVPVVSYAFITVHPRVRFPQKFWRLVLRMRDIFR